MSNNIHEIKFGTGGWRGIIGDDFIKSNIQRVGYGICLLAEEQNKTDTPIIIGYDRRFLSRECSEWLAEVISAMGIKVELIGRSTPTPLIMYLTEENQNHFGIEVTASHNPSEYNGIKLIVDEGRDAPIEVTSRLEEIISENSDVDIPVIPFKKALEEEKITYLNGAFNSFIDHILDMLDHDAIRNRSLRILFDPMHGSGIYPLTVILQTLRCTVDMINYNKDAYFGGGSPAPAESRLKDLSHHVVEEKYDLGIALDGDGDRLGIIDEKGNYIDANKILCLLYDYLYRVKGWNGPVVRNLATTHMLDSIAESFGQQCHEVPVGFKYISAGIDKYDAVLGGESSGGLTVRGHIHGKDSIYAASLFIEMVCVTGMSPTELISELESKHGKYELVESNLAFSAENKPTIYKTIITDKRLPSFEGKTIEKVSYEDGCKVYFSDRSFVICRFSGTEPLLRIFAEASTDEIASGYINAFKNMLNL